MELGIDEMLAPAKGEAARGLRSAKSKMIEVSLPAGDPRLPVPELPVRLSDIKTAASALRTGKQAAAKAHLVKFDQLPFIERNAAGEPVRGLAIDRWAYTNGALLIAGWVIGVGDEEIRIDGAADGSDVLVSVFRRPDVEDAFPALRSTTKGLLAVIKPGEADRFSLFGFTVQLPPRRENDTSCEALLAEHRERMGFLLRNLPHDSPELSRVAAQIPAAPDTYRRARGFLEQARGVPNHGGLVIGWAVNLPGVQLALLDPAGRMMTLAGAIRWYREDIVQAVGQDYGNYTFNSGLLQAWQHAFRIGDEIRLVVFDGDAAYMLSAGRWEAAPTEPTSFARWAFELPTPLDRFCERMENHDGAIIESLIARDRAHWRTVVPDVHQFGLPVENPKCSIIVPLYGRFDFLLNQMLEFSEDEQIKHGADLIYVVDDPRIASNVVQQAWLLYEANRVPFRLVVSPDNRGYAGANNLGISVSRAPYLLLLNSDVIPVEPGWLDKMLAAIDRDPSVGIVGARLFYPNGSIQHDGMSFQWEPSWNAFLNKHPRSGMEASTASVEGKNHAAVSAACLLIRRSTYDSVGGLDEGFLIGDFEDSDLCLKVRQQGLRIICLGDLNLTHLERQSFTGIGANGFRERVSRYNAWRHQRRWSDYIEALARVTEVSK
jgi:O-antigen biosynthesis protein